MIFEVDGKEIEVEDAKVLEKVKALPEYNQEIDRILDKRVGTTKQDMLSTFENEKAELISTYSREIENAKKLNGGKKDDQITALQDQLQTLTDNFSQAQAEKKEIEKQAKISNVKADLSSKFSSVQNEYDRKNMIRDAMESVSLENDSISFKLSTGAMGSADDIVNQFKQSLPDRFNSDQGGGLGINGSKTIGGGVPHQGEDLTIQQREENLRAKINR